MRVGRDPVRPAGLRSPDTYLPALETLRGVAIVLVVLFHFFGILGGDRSPDAPLPLRWIAAGNTGVTLFFILSGFLLARPFIASVREGRARPPSTGRFYRARCLRILPAYLVVVAIAWIVTRDGALWKALLFVPLGYQAFPFALPWWSLSTEVQFYILLPLIMLLPRSRTGAMVLGLAILSWFALYLWCAVLLDWPESIRPLRNSLFGRGTAFLGGAALAWFHASAGFGWLCRSRALVWAVFAGSLILLLSLMAWCGARAERDAVASLPVYHDIEAVLWCGVTLGYLAGADGMVPWILRYVLDFTAASSYSMYLTHVPIQFYILYPVINRTEAATTGAPLWAHVAITAAACWCVAWIGYRFVERPFLLRKATS